jgi:hypothetical protein
VKLTASEEAVCPADYQLLRFSSSEIQLTSAAMLEQADPARQSRK